MGKEKFIDAGLFVLRLGIGLSMALFHGWGKISGGPEYWAKLGTSMSQFGITFWPILWGFSAAFAEFFGSIMLILGFGFRIACLLLFLTMMVAAYKHLSLPPEAVKSGWKGASHALEFLTIYLALFLTGPGKFALNQKIKFGKKR